ncbi:MAG: Ribonuclease III [Candidatus Bipolaricaulis sibiricus]|uniref:Ribonuclease 3 n=1 Tax=Bipolaricaulis sibiricus TaxID=2501609 RepID=A0A410FTF6_BIPS1|nr:MAG: Ribonuclease III [Candidatus Bipolaricaulis sibiricus]
MSNPLRTVLAQLGLDLPDGLLRTALTHDSYANEHGGDDNERLEFLGDAVLDLAVADISFHLYPDQDEGELSKLRAVAVSRPVLAEVAAELGLGNLLLVGKGADEGGARTRPSVLASALEAVFGAVFLRHGYAPARTLADTLLGPRISAGASVHAPDYKSLLQELGQARFGALPQYEVIAAEGPEHKKVFAVRASLPAGEAIGRGRSKKEAEQAAAKRLYVRLSTEAAD